MSGKPSIVFCHGLWADGSCFNKVMGPLRAEGYEVIASEHRLDSAADLFTQKVDGVAWRTKPSWCIVGKNDHTVNPALERSAAQRMGATTYEFETSHVPMLSRPDLVLDVVRAAANAVQESLATA
jgi:hypothetical protein